MSNSFIIRTFFWYLILRLFCIWKTAFSSRYFYCLCILECRICLSGPPSCSCFLTCSCCPPSCSCCPSCQLRSCGRSGKLSLDNRYRGWAIGCKSFQSCCFSYQVFKNLQAMLYSIQGIQSDFAQNKYLHYAMPFFYLLSITFFHHISFLYLITYIQEKNIYSMIFCFDRTSLQIRIFSDFYCFYVFF